MVERVFNGEYQDMEKIDTREYETFQVVGF